MFLSSLLLNWLKSSQAPHSHSTFSLYWFGRHTPSPFFERLPLKFYQVSFHQNLKVGQVSSPLSQVPRELRACSNRPAPGFPALLCRVFRLTHCFPSLPQCYFLCCDSCFAPPVWFRFTSIFFIRPSSLHRGHQSWDHSPSSSTTSAESWALLGADYRVVFVCALGFILNR